LLDEDESTSTVNETPIWLVLTTKTHIASSHRLQPYLLPVPTSLDADEDATICLITADPQSAYKAIVHTELPEALRKRITRVIDFSHLKAKYKRYEAQRKLLSEHDIFLADDRIVSRLPETLGKTFYNSTTKRPIPIVLSKRRAKVNGKRVKREKGKDELNARPAAEIAAQIEKAISSALVYVSSSTTTSIRVGTAGWQPEQLSANIEALIPAVVDKYVPQKWDNMRGIFVKSPQSTSLPIWQTAEMWVKEGDVLEDGSVEQKALGAPKDKTKPGKKRKGLEGAEAVPRDRSTKKAKLPESNDEDLDKQISDRKARLRKQKSAAKLAMES